MSLSSSPNPKLQTSEEKYKMENPTVTSETTVTQTVATGVVITNPNYNSPTSKGNGNLFNNQLSPNKSGTLGSAPKVTVPIEKDELETFSKKPANYRKKFENGAQRKEARKRAWTQSRIAMICEPEVQVTTSSSTAVENVNVESDSDEKGGPGTSDKTTTTVGGPGVLVKSWLHASPEKIGKCSQSVGLQLYFLYLRNSAIVLAFWSILVSVLVGFCAEDSGEHSDDKTGAAGTYAVYSLASFGDATQVMESGPTHTTVSVENRTMILNDEEVYMKDWTPTLSVLGALGAFMYFLFVLRFKFLSVPRAVDAFDSGTISPADFTVEVNNLPSFDLVDKHEYEDKVREHFAEVLKAAKDERRKIAIKKLGLNKNSSNGNEIGSSGTTSKLEHLAIKEAADDYNDLNELFPEVSLVRDYEGRLMERMKENQVRQSVIEATLDDDEKKIKKVRKTAEKLVEKKRAKLAKKKNKSESEAVTEIQEEDRQIFRCFLTCKLAIDKELILERYRMSKFSLGYLCQSRKNRFQGKRIVVTEAPEPSNILWENQDCPKFERFLRQSLTKFIVTILLVLTMCGILYSKKYQTEQTEKAQGVDCREPYELIPEVTHVSANNNGVFSGNDVQITPVATKNWINLKKATSGPDWDMKNTLTDCQCSGIGLTSLVADDDLKVACDDFVQAQYLMYGITIASSVIVIAINFGLKSVLVSLAAFERPLTVSGLECAISLKVFIAQWINTAVIVYLLNSKFLGDLGFNGEYDDFNHQWYATVGLALTMTLLVNIFSPHMIGVAVSFWDRIKRTFIARCCSSTEEQIYTAYEPPVFELAPRCGALLNTIFSSLTFAAGCPLLIWFFFFNQVLTYICDKYLLLRVSKRPPAFDQKVLAKMINVIPFALLLHGVFGVLMCGNPKVFPSLVAIEYRSWFDNDYKKDLSEATQQTDASSNDPLASTTQDIDDFGNDWPTIIRPIVKFIDRAARSAGLPWFLLTLFITIYFILDLVKLILGPAFTVVISGITQCCCFGRVTGGSSDAMHRLILGDCGPFINNINKDTCNDIEGEGEEDKGDGKKKAKKDDDDDELDPEYLTNWFAAKRDWEAAKITAGYMMIDNDSYSAMAASDLDLDDYADSGELRKRVRSTGSSLNNTGPNSPNKSLSLNKSMNNQIQNGSVSNGVISPTKDSSSQLIIPNAIATSPNKSNIVAVSNNFERKNSNQDSEALVSSSQVNINGPSVSVAIADGNEDSGSDI